MSKKTEKNKVSDDTLGAVAILGLGILGLAIPPLFMLGVAIIGIWLITDPYKYGDRSLMFKKYKK